MRAFFRVGASMLAALASCSEGADLRPTPVGITVSPQPLDFGAVQVGELGQRTLVVTNLGAGSITIEFERPHAPFELVSPVAARIDGYGATELVLRFGPFRTEPSRETLMLRPSEGEAKTVDLIGEGIEVIAPAVVCVTSSDLDFGEVAVGASRTLELMLSSCGPEPVPIARVHRLAGSDPTFQLGAAPLFAPPAGDAPATLAITFSPEAATPATGALRIEPADGPPLDVSVLGRGVPPCALSTAPARLEFAESVTTKRFLVTNAGPICALAGVHVAPVEAPFVIVGDWEGAVIGADTSTVVTVEYVGSGEPAMADAVVTGAAGDEHRVPLSKRAQTPGCALDVEPGFVALGLVAVGTEASGHVVVTNVGDALCKLELPALVGSSTAALTVRMEGNLRIQPSERVTFKVRYAPRQEAVLDARIAIRSDAVRVFGPEEVPIFARAQQGALCVEPERVDFPATNGPMRRSVTLWACAGRDVRVHGLDWKWGHPAFRVTTSVTTPFDLVAGSRFPVEVEYTAQDELVAEDDLVVRSNAVIRPRIDVRFHATPLAAPEAGRYLYGWQRSDAGTVVRAALPDGVAQPFIGRRVDQSCAGCHNPSPDGRYLLLSGVWGYDVLEVATGTYVRRERNVAVSLGSWNPNVQTNPPYQIVFAMEIGGLHITSALGGPTTSVPGASDPSVLQLMPSWGSDGRIAFVRAPEWGWLDFVGPSDILTIPETGGVATVVPGVGAAGLSNYYPTFSPNAEWIAFAECPSDPNTRGCVDARVRVVRSDGSGQLLTLDAVNDGHHSTTPSWNLTGRLLAFASDRPGGLGGLDVYVVAFDPVTGVTGRPRPVPGMNTVGQEYWVQWSR